MPVVGRTLLALSLCAVGCTKSNPVSCVDGYCQDPALPFCDVDGALEGHPQTCIAVDCTPNAFAGCRMDQAIVCNASGDDYDLSHCPDGCDPNNGCIQRACTANTAQCGDRVVERCDGNGILHTEACDLACVTSPAPHCAYLSPKYLPDVCDAPATTPSIELTNTVTLDTSSVTTCNGGVVPQAGGPEICVLRYGTVSVATGASVRFVGSRAIAIVADGTLDISGILDVSARTRDAGPGVVGVSGTSPTTGGGGGAGFATGGAAGGSATQTGGGGAGGFNASPLTRGYFAGGFTAASSAQGARGGGGGGGAMLISCRGRVSVTGSIGAGGGGGIGGGISGFISVGGGGGGSGGYIVLQGLGVGVTGRLGANGGGGGCGKPTSAAQGADGPDAGDVTTTGCIATTGSGGAGGSASMAPQPGGASNMETPGGGGGSMGFLQTYTPATIIPTLTPAAVSPAFETNLNVPTR